MTFRNWLTFSVPVRLRCKVVVCSIVVKSKRRWRIVDSFYLQRGEIISEGISGISIGYFFFKFFHEYFLNKYNMKQLIPLHTISTLFHHIVPSHYFYPCWVTHSLFSRTICIWVGKIIFQTKNCSIHTYILHTNTYGPFWKSIRKETLKSG